MRFLNRYVQPQQRFSPMSEGAVQYALQAAQEEDIRQELRDHDWPSAYWNRVQAERHDREYW